MREKRTICGAVVPSWMAVASLTLLSLGAGSPTGADPGGQVPSSGAAAPTATPNFSGNWIGQTAKPFALRDTKGTRVDIGKVLGTRPVVLIFYRGVWCPFCHKQMRDLGHSRTDFEKTGASVYAISNEGAPAQTRMQTVENVGYIHFLSDPDGAAAKLYSGLYPASTVHQPGVFVIDRHGKIIYAYVNQGYKTRAAESDVLAALRQAR